MYQVRPHHMAPGRTYCSDRPRAGQRLGSATSPEAGFVSCFLAVRKGEKHPPPWSGGCRGRTWARGRARLSTGPSSAKHSDTTSLALRRPRFCLALAAADSSVFSTGSQACQGRRGWGGGGGFATVPTTAQMTGLAAADQLGPAGCNNVPQSSVKPNAGRCTTYVTHARRDRPPG